MFGYLRGFRHGMSKRLNLAYKNYYCGTCFALQYNYGQLSRFLLSYDLIIIGLLLKSHKQPSCERMRCFGEKDKKQQFTNDDWKTVAALTLLLTAEKLRDDIEDENSFKAKFAFGIFKKSIKKAQREFPEMYSIIASGYQKILAKEKTNKNVIEIAEEFSALMESVYKCIQSDQSDDNTVRIEYIKVVSEWLYFIDALDDYEKDVEKGRFNPLIKDHKPSHNTFIDSNFVEICGLIRHFYQKIRDVANELPQSCVEDELLNNILKNTIPSMTATVLNKHKKPKLRHFKAGTVWSDELLNKEI